MTHQLSKHYALDDLYQRLSPRPIGEYPVGIIDIDEKSLARLVNGHGRGRQSLNWSNKPINWAQPSLLRRCLR